MKKMEVDATDHDLENANDVDQNGAEKRWDGMQDLEGAGGAAVENNATSTIPTSPGVDFFNEGTFRNTKSGVGL